MKKYVQLKTKDDFYAFSKIKNLVTDSSTIPSNSCSYNTTYSAFRINDSSNIVKGAIEVPLGKLYIGDIVRITAEVYNISGVKAKIALDGEGGNIGILQTSKTNEFEKISSGFVCTRNENYTAVLGVWTADIGDYYIRNVSIEVDTGGSNVIKPLKESKRVYNFHAEGSFVLKTEYSPDTCTIEIDNRFGVKLLKIVHDIPFTSSVKGVSFANISAGSNVKYIVRTRTEMPDSLYVAIIDRTTNQIIDPATVLNDSTFWFSVVHIGYDI